MEFDSDDEVEIELDAMAYLIHEWNWGGICSAKKGGEPCEKLKKHEDKKNSGEPESPDLIAELMELSEGFMRDFCSNEEEGLEP